MLAIALRIHTSRSIARMPSPMRCSASRIVTCIPGGWSARVFTLLDRGARRAEEVHGQAGVRGGGRDRVGGGVFA